MRAQTLIFLTSFEYPSKHAHPIHGLEMARAWTALLGGQFVFVIGRTTHRSTLEGVSYRNAFGRWGVLIKKSHLRTVAYFLWLCIFCLRERTPRPIVFVNDIRIGISAALLRRVFSFTFVFESHGVYGRSAERIVYGCADKVVFVTAALRERAIVHFPRLTRRSIVVSNAVDVSRFDAVTATSQQLREELSLPQGILVGYIGRFSPGRVDKGVEFMLRSLPALSEPYRMLFVGGTEEEIRVATNLATALGVAARATFVPFVESSLLPRYAKACDMLVYVPAAADSVFHLIETSPMKLFEYMAARRPIIVSDTSPVREVLDASCAYFCTPGSVPSFVKAVSDLAQDGSRKNKVENAYERVRANTWHRRASTILSFEKTI